jgi:hypothetical protein
MSSDFTDSPSPHEGPDEGYTERPRRPRRREEDYGDEDRDVPRLGSLAQKARGKQLNQARGILLVIGILTVLGNAALTLAAPEMINKEIEAEIQKQGGRGRVVVNEAVIQQVKHQAMMVVYIINGAFIVLGTLFIVFGLMVKRFPVPVTVAALVLYILATVAQFGLMALEKQDQAAGRGVGIALRIIFIIALVKALQAALAYERERRAEADFDEV